MTDKEKAQMIEEASAAVSTIKKQFKVDVIKDCEMPPLVNFDTGKYTGFAVQLELSTRYNYDEFLLTQWKKMLKADEWYISVKRCQLHVIYKVRYKEAKK